MNNPLLYPFLAIICILLLPCAAWLWFTLKERRRVAKLTPHEAASEAVYKFLTSQRPSVDVAPPYRHRGHPHAAARRGKNRADRRAES